MTRALLLSGTGAYGDPWHDYAATSSRIAALVADLDIDVTIDDDVERGLAQLSISTTADLLIVNAGNPESNGLTADTPAAARQGLADHIAAGKPVLAVHAAASTLPDVDQWERLVGGRWVPGTSTHPALDWASITVLTDAHPIVAGFPDFQLEDERYSYLRTGSDNVVLAHHEWDGKVHPLYWARQSGCARVVYDGLGHGVESYQSSGRCELLQRSVRWLTVR